MQNVTTDIWRDCARLKDEKWSRKRIYTRVCWKSSAAQHGADMYTLWTEKNSPTFFVISSTKTGYFWQNLVCIVLSKFVIQWCKRFYLTWIISLDYLAFAFCKWTAIGTVNRKNTPKCFWPRRLQNPADKILYILSWIYLPQNSIIYLLRWKTVIL